MQNSYAHDFSGKTVVITGGAGVICSAIAKAFAECGAKVALLGLHTENVLEKAAEIVSAGGIAKGYACNVLDMESIRLVRESILAELGSCDILINGAGGNNPQATTGDEYYDPAAQDGKTFFDLEPDSIKQVFDLNMLGSLLPVQVFAKDMIGKKGCSIINISSMNAYTPLTKIPAYSAAKAAVSNFTQWLATYFSRVGIRCNAIAPGFLSTRQNAQLLFNADGTPTARSGKILRNTPMERFGSPEEMAGAALFLANEKASGFITGVILPIDGGFSAYSGV